MQCPIKDSLTEYIKKMPALPTSIGKVMEVCNDPTSSSADLSRVISLDPVLMGRVMQLINSAYYGLNNKITSLVRAIIMLGLNTVKNLALSTAILGTVGKVGSKVLKIEDFWIHSLGVGVTAKLIAKKRGESSKDLEEFFVAGLLHDIGKLPFINRVPEEYGEAMSLSKTASISLWEAEYHHLSCTHTEIGEMIAWNWKLNENLIHAIAHHHEIYRGPHQTLVYIVSAANYYTHLMGMGFSGNAAPHIHEEIFPSLDLSLHAMEDMEVQIREIIENARVFLRLAMDNNE